MTNSTVSMIVASLLTQQPWHKAIVSKLGVLGQAQPALLGVDIGHVKMPGLVASEACAGFFEAGGELTAGVSLFPAPVGPAFKSIQGKMRGKKKPALDAYRAVAYAFEQVNTLIFNGFTLTYAPSIEQLSGPEQTVRICHLHIHPGADRTHLDLLKRNIERGLQAFADAHDAGGNLEIVAPSLQDLNNVLR